MLYLYNLGQAATGSYRVETTGHYTPDKREFLDKLKARDFNATSLSTYDFSTLYTTLPHNLIKDKLIDLIERTFQREGSPYLACNDRNAFFTSENPKNIMHGRVKMYVMR